MSEEDIESGAIWDNWGRFLIESEELKDNGSLI